MARLSLLSLPLFVIYGTLLGRSDGASYFQPECTHPPNGTNFVGNPNTRSTMGIIWSVLSIIILCTLNILHLNVPAIRPPTKSKWRKVWYKIWDSKTKLKWMLFTILVPEFIMAKALSEEQHDIHTHLANMGHFILDWGDPTTWTREDEDLKGTWNEVRQAIDDVLDQPSLSRTMRVNVSRLKSCFWALNADQWRLCRSWGFGRLPDTPDWQLEKLDNSSALVKLLAIIQVVWLIVQLIARKIGGHPSSQLEISALAFAVCSIVTYIAYWNHPRDVEAVCFIKAEAWKIDPSIHPQNEAIRLIRELGLQGPSYLWSEPRIQSKIHREANPKPIPNHSLHEITDNPYKVSGGILPLTLGAVFGGSLFGGLHCLAWNFQFPTSGEVLGWRICSIATACIPIVCFLLAILWAVMNWVPDDGGDTRRVRATWAFKWFNALFLLLPYILARLLLIVESVRSIFFLPPEAYVDTWTGLFPHWG